MERKVAGELGVSEQRRRRGCKVCAGEALCDLNLTEALETALVSGDSPFPPFTLSATPCLGYSRTYYAMSPPPPPISNLNYT